MTPPRETLHEETRVEKIVADAEEGLRRGMQPTLVTQDVADLRTLLSEVAALRKECDDLSTPEPLRPFELAVTNASPFHDAPVVVITREAARRIVSLAAQDGTNA